jgi:hypothetical protein
MVGCLKRALSSPRTTVIEIRTDRDANLRLHRRIEQAVLAALRTDVRLARSGSAVGAPLVAGDREQ